MRFILSSNHKNIGTLYLVFAIIAGVIGVALSLAMRLELNEPDIQYFHGLASFLYGFEGDAARDAGAQIFALFSSAHAIVMIFFMVVPALFGGFSNWLVPLMIGTGDMAFPVLNRIAYFLLFPALAFLVCALVFASSTTVVGVLMIVALHIAALSAILSAVNFISTIITARAPGMALRDMPVFVWSVLVASFMMVVSMPVMAAAISKIIVDFAFGSVAAPVAASAPDLQVMMWFFAHPEIYVFILPAFGIISHVVATFARRPLFCESGVIAAMITIGCAGFILWTQNLFHTDGKTDMQTYFFWSLPIIVLPAAVIVFSWLVTIWMGQLSFRVPMLWAMAFQFMLVIGTISAIHLAVAEGTGTPANYIGHFHYVLSLGAVFAIFSGWYFWFPKMSGYEVRPFTGVCHFWIMFIAVNLVFLPQHFQGFIHQPGSIAAIIDSTIGWGRLSTVGAVIAAFSLVVFFYGIIEAFVRKVAAGSNPWGEGAATLEWQLPSPPEHEWQKVPVFVRNGCGQKTE